MLILSRKCGESLLIDQEIEIRITEINGDRVKIGIEAPQSVKVVRKELVQTMESNKQAASTGLTKDIMKFLKSLQ